jgi:putative phosphoesterase
MIFVLSDTHVPERIKELPRKLVERIGPADLILHAGDFVVWEVFRQLGSLATVHAVRGNVDDAKLRRFLPETKVVEVNGKRIGLCHGWGPRRGLPERVYKQFGRGCDVLVFGHSHLPYNRRKGRTLMLNPGSLSGNASRYSGASYAVLTVEGDEVWAEIVEMT